MSTIVTYDRAIGNIPETLDGSVQFDRPIDLAFSRAKYVRLIQANFTSNLLNLFSVGRNQKLPIDPVTNPAMFNNARLLMTKDDWATEIDIQLPNGIYTIKYIQSAIRDVISDWWTNSSEPGFSLEFNLATHQVYITLDSSKLAVAGQLGIDFISASHSLGEVLGFTDPTRISADGIHIANTVARVDYFGNNASLLIEGLGNISLKNGSKSDEIAVIPLATSNLGNQYIFPSAEAGGFNAPKILLESCPNPISKLNFKIRGDRIEPDGTQRLIYGMDGHITVVLEISWY